jgi:hypothetical protein
VKKPIAILAAFLVSPALFAASETATEAPLKVYEIEVMVFQNIRPEAEGEELWMSERIDPEIKDLDKAVAISTIPGEDSDLTKVREIIEQDSNYRVLVHKQWAQNADTRSESKLVQLNTDDGELNGTFKFFMSRFLHVDVNLLYKESDSKSLFQAGNTENAADINYEIREQRRVRSNEMQYFDHPKFGLLVMVQPVDTTTH